MGQKLSSSVQQYLCQKWTDLDEIWWGTGPGRFWA